MKKLFLAFALIASSCQGSTDASSPITQTSDSEVATTTTSITQAPSLESSTSLDEAPTSSTSETPTEAVPSDALVGVSLPSTEWGCSKDNPYLAEYDPSVIIPNLQQLNVNLARLPFNGNCWLIYDWYRQGMYDIVAALTGGGVNVMLDLHWISADGSIPTSQAPMAPESATDFWLSVAQTFNEVPGVIAYELYNEPAFNIDGGGFDDADWSCWLNGCDIPEMGTRSAGMQAMVDAIRSTGSTQLLVVNGLDYSNEFLGIQDWLPTDPLDNLAVGVHIYDETEFQGKCVDEVCWERELRPLAATQRVMITEFGSRIHCDPNFSGRVIDFARSAGIEFVAWAYYPADCGFPGLLSSWDGTLNEAGYALCVKLNGVCN